MKTKTFITGFLVLALTAAITTSFELNRKEKVILERVYPPHKKVVIIKTNEMPVFMADLGFRESSDNYKAINRFGYIGRYQFGTAALTDLGIKNKSKFLNNKLLQDKAFIALCKINKYRLRKYIDKYEGAVINGITITESGLLAASHLVGARSVKRYLRSNGKRIRRDANNISLEHYLKLFQGYKLEIEASRVASL